MAINFFQTLKKISRKLFSEPVGKQSMAFGHSSYDPKTDLTGYKISADSFFTVYKNQSDVYACVREYEQNVLAAGFHWENIDDPEGTPDQKFVDKAESVLNFFEPFRNLKKRQIRDFMIAGNVYNNLVKNKAGTDILGIQPFDPRTAALVTDKHGTIHKYVQSAGVGNEVVVFDPEEVAHWKNGTDPNHEAFGMSPMEPILWEARTDLAAMLQNFFFFKNNATPDVLYIMSDEIQGKEAIDEAMDNIKKQFQGVDKSHKSAILHGVKEVKTINITQKDMEFLSGRRFTTEKICACFGVPKAVLNYTDGVNYSTAEIQYIKFIENSVTPVDEDFVDFYNREIWSRVKLNGVAISDKIKMVANAQATEAQGGVEERALREYQAGALTLRQYKQKTNQEIHPDDDKNPMFDSYILHNGAGAVLLEDVGVDPILDPNNQQSAKSFLDQLNNFKKQLNDKTRT